MKKSSLHFKIGNKHIGADYPVFIIAEISANHHQSLEKAKKLVEAACKAGADAIKLQTYTPDTMTIDSNKDWFQIKVNDAWKGQSLYSLYKTAYTPWEWHPKLEKIAKRYGVPLFSTGYDDSSIDFLEKMNVPAYKIASFEVTDIELIKKVARTKKPVMISRGMSSLSELERAISTLRQYGTKDLAVLHCVSSYPAAPEEMDLATIPYIGKIFNVIPGLSDHTISTTTAIAGTVLGACIIEKHVTMKRSEGGPDSAFSLEPHELKQLINSVRDAKKAVGTVRLHLGKKERENAGFRRGLWITKSMKKGECLTRNHVKRFRPNFGIPIYQLPLILGRPIKKDIQAPKPVTWNII